MGEKPTTAPGRDADSANSAKGDNVLPAYCNPPNPCPIGHTSKSIFIIMLRSNSFHGIPSPPHPFPIISSFLFTLSIISWFLVIWKRESWNNWCSYSIGRRERLRGGVWEHGCLQQRVPVGAGLHVRHGAHVRLPGIVREERQRKEPRQCRHRQYGGHRHPQDNVWLPSNSHPPNSLAIFFVSFSSFIFLFWKMGFEATFLGFFETALLDFVGC